jgi:hypothetical protein
MKAVHLLRIAAILTLLYCAGHTAGMPWTPYSNSEALAILEAMQHHRFEAEGFKGTYWDLYFGFGLTISVCLLVQAAVLWQVASLAKTDAIRVRPIVVSFLVAFVINAALAWNYFFAVPAGMATAIALCLAVSLVLARSSQPAHQGAAPDGPALRTPKRSGP